MEGPTVISTAHKCTRGAWQWRYSPQRADEAVHGPLGIQGYDVPDVEEAGCGVRHSAAGFLDPSAPRGTLCRSPRLFCPWATLQRRDRSFGSSWSPESSEKPLHIQPASVVPPSGTHRRLLHDSEVRGGRSREDFVQARKQLIRPRVC